MLLLSNPKQNNNIPPQALQGAQKDLKSERNQIKSPIKRTCNELIAAVVTHSNDINDIFYQLHRASETEYISFFGSNVIVLLR